VHNPQQTYWHYCFVKKIFFLLLYLFSFTVSASSDRIALVIGNSKYTELGSLANPINDAKSINKILQEMGYKTKLVLDATESTIRKDLRSFASESDNASIALVFFAGHGAQINGENYLLPVDIEIPKRESDIQLSALKVDDVINSIKSKTKVIFLDACRDNPALIKSLTKGRGSFRSGLAPTNTVSISDQSSGIFIAYATDASNIASDGPGQLNSPFTTALLKYIKQPVSIDDMFSMVTKEVRQSTKNAQKPYKYASLDGLICLPGKCERFIDTKIGEGAAKIPPVVSNGGALDGSTTWTLFQTVTKTKSLVYIDLKSIKNFGTRVSTDQKWVNDEDGSYEIVTYALDCNLLFGNVTKVDKYDRNGKLLNSSIYGNAVSIDLKFDYTNKESVAFFAMQIACNPEKRNPLVSSAQLDSSDWERFYTIKEGVELHYLKNSKRMIDANSGKDSQFSFFNNITQRNTSKEAEIITKITFPRTKGSDMKKAINIDLGLENYKLVPYATSLVTKARFICGKNTYYPIIENWFDQDKSLVGFSNVVSIEISTKKDEILPYHPDSVLAQLSRYACN
jgi:hypothetical protein